MSMIDEGWKANDRVSVFVVSLVALLVLLVAGLVLADRSLRESMDFQAHLDATASAKIVAEEVELVGEHLYELGTGSVREGKLNRLRTPMSVGQKGRAIRAVWVLDTLGRTLIDSAWWHEPQTTTRGFERSIRQIARHVAVSRSLQLRGLRSVGNSSGQYEYPEGGQALLAEPIVMESRFMGIAVALVDERKLLAPAESAMAEDRSFLALLADGDTIVRSMDEFTQHRRQSAPVRLPLPGEPPWFVISAQTPRENASRIVIWTLGSMALLLLLFALARERRQTARIAERSVELERLSAELLRANRMKSEFLANVSHELRTPLNAIVGFVDLLRDGGYGALSSRQISPVERIATSANRLRTLVDQVLDIAKIAAGRLDVRLEAISLRAFLTNVVSEIEPLVAEKQLEVRIASASDLPKIRTDPTHLRQILINLLGNAVKYTDAGGVELNAYIAENPPPPRSLTVTGQHPTSSTGAAERWVAIDVADSGVGIAPEDLERIFDEFEQVRPQASSGSANGSTGLGLAISRRLATLLGGDVTVESTQGVGSTFTVWLPIRDGQTGS
jgi:signal transduction histidine kinase